MGRGTHPLQLLVRKAHAVLHPNLVTNAAVLAEDGDALHLDPVLDNARRVARGRDGRPLNTSPRAHARPPPDDGVQHARVVLDLRVLENNRLLDARAGPNHHARPNRHVGPQLGGRVDRGSGVHKHGRNDVRRRRRELLGPVLHGPLEVQRVGRDRGPRRLDLAPEVARLAHEELLVVREVGEDVLLEADDLVGRARVVAEDGAGGEVLGAGVRDEARGAVVAALDGVADGGEDGLGGEEVHARVDQVADVALGLLDVVQHAARVVVGHDAPEVARGLARDPSAQDDGLGVLLVGQPEHLGQRERAAHVRVQYEQLLGPPLEDGVAEVVESARGAEGLVLAQVLDGQAGELGAGVLDEVLEDLLLVVADYVDLAEVVRRQLREGLDAVPDDGVAGDFEEGLGDVEGEGPEARAARGAADLGNVSWGCTVVLGGRGTGPRAGVGWWELTKMTALVDGSWAPRWGTWRDMVIAAVDIGGGRGKKRVVF